MSARSRRKHRRTRVSRNPAQAINRWLQAVDLRTEWLGHALRTDPADRGTAEDAIAGIYTLLGRPRPEFVWVDSPSAAAQLVPPPQPPRAGGPWRLENQLASLMAELRGRLDRCIGIDQDWDWPPIRSLPEDPAAELRSGTALSTLVDRGVRGVLRQVIRESVADLVRAAAPELPGLVWYGQHDADWVAYYDIHRRITRVHFGEKDTAHLDLWAALARSCGWWWPREGRCVVTERPSVVRAEPAPNNTYGQLRLHSETGPTVVYPDGWSVHVWHGTRVPAWVIEAPTVERITAERNVEVRRCAIERLGWETFIAQAGLKPVAQAPDPGNPGCELHLYDPPYPGVRLLLAVNGSVERDGTRRRYGLHVPPWFDNPIDAAGWSYGLTGAQYAQLCRRT